ncbi:MAG TPA: hypothetical protein VFU46_06935 [Gemmatimonadales bacterium]|nr:hypothetical protein [Gemmatimonadales bacterium]
MSRRYWLRIALGALLVFGAGMASISLYHRGVHTVETLATTSEPITIPLSIMPFQLEGERIGRIQEIRIDRDQPDRIAGLAMRVRLSDSGAAAGLAACALTVQNPGTVRPDPSFRCASPADSTADSLVPFGEVRFEPGGVTRAFLLPAGLVAEWRNAHAEIVAAPAEAGSAAESAHQHARRARARTRALIHIDNDSGRPVLELRADSTGAKLRVRDDTGRDVLYLDADSSGARLMVRGDSGRRKP